MNKLGYGPADLDESSANSAAIRGREQMLTDANGGAQSMGGTSGNAINGISPNNPKSSSYMGAAESEFGPAGGGGGAALPGPFGQSAKSLIPEE
ncbi:hypothetical protein [Paraburkholderia antibiotica]|nr:hypothetical protein [Paraburkholderia antibiotica]